MNLSPIRIGLAVNIDGESAMEWRLTHEYFHIERMLPAGYNQAP